MSTIGIGDVRTLDWNSAKKFGDKWFSGDEIRVEAIGTDWIVARTTSRGEPLFAGFKNKTERNEFWDKLAENDEDE